MFTVFVTRFILYFDILEDKQIENMLISDHIKPLDNCDFLMFTVFVTRFTLYFDILEEQIENMLICNCIKPLENCVLYTLESHNCQVV
jgi:hypothetical protein